MVAGCGHVSPMVHIKSYFLDAILQLAVMRQPVTLTIALEKINSMIKDMTIEAQIVECKKKHYQMPVRLMMKKKIGQPKLQHILA